MKTNKNMSNEEVAKLLRSVAAAYQVKGDGEQDRFKVIAYERASDVIDHMAVEVRELWKRGQLDGIEGIGKSIAAHLGELFQAGKVKHYEEVLGDLPPAMFELLDVPGLGAKRALKLTKTLGITKEHGALEKLKQAAEKGKIREIEGFGEQSEKDILASVTEVKKRVRRHLLPHALPVAEAIVEWMRKDKNVEKVDPLGSLRRSASTVGDIDIAVASSNPKSVIEHFINYPDKTKIIEAGDTTASIALPGGFQVDLMVQPPDAYGALLQHFTGSKQHNVELRAYAQRKGLSLSEYGIKTDGEIAAEGEPRQRREKFKTEEEFYNKIGMDWISPQMREAKGEIYLAIKHQLPKLIELSDMKGDLHIHSDFLQDVSHDPGRSSMEEMVKVAEDLGYEYIAFTEHNPKSELTDSKALDMIKRKAEKVAIINSSLSKNGLKHVFNSLEIDIKVNGDLALPGKAFDYLDFAIVSVHSSFRLPGKEQTKRVLEGLLHPKVKILGHPTGRKLNEREGIQLDWDQIFEYCKARDKWLEINSWPERLDLPDSLAWEAVKRGIRLVINTDSHAADQLNGIRYGISVAQRAWATKGDIINTLEYNKLKGLLEV